MHNFAIISHTFQKKGSKMDLKEAMVGLDKALDDAKAALYAKEEFCLSDDETVVYNAMRIKADDFVKFMDFLIKAWKNERCNKNCPSPFGD